MYFAPAAPETRRDVEYKLSVILYFFFVDVLYHSDSETKSKGRGDAGGAGRGQNIALPLEFNEGQRYRSTSDVPMGKHRDSSTLRRVRQFPRSLGGYLFSLLLPVMLIPCPFTALHRLILIIFPSLNTRPRAFGVLARFVQPT